MRALVTGASGFVGPYLLKELVENGVSATTIDPTVDVSSFDQLLSAVSEFADGTSESKVIFHLAALSHVGASWKDPMSYLNVNVGGTLNLLRAIEATDPNVKLVYVSSSEVYGNQSHLDAIDEATPLRPLSPYASSKAAAETYVLQYGRAFGIKTVVARPFNHIGPNQSSNFLVSAIAKRICDARISGESEIAVGNLGATRDFLDVRDVVRAYRLLAVSDTSFDTYNISSGVGRKIEEVVQMLIAIDGDRVKASVSPELLRPVEVMRIVGDSSRISNELGFEPKFSIEETLREVISYWREDLGAS
ncbi:MAG: GDP-mannose 4,6-dehydratase [Actinomycetota bacterium]|nr:GDP-mannose 4,6-dehydratase [Actinomycetota bacterium]